LERRLKGMKISAEMLSERGYPSHKEFLDTYGYQAILNEIHELWESVVELQSKAGGG